MKHILRFLPILAMLVVTPAFADEPKGDAPPPAADGKPSAAEKKLGYSLPWLLRPAVATNALRVDQNLVFQDGSSVQLNVITASYKLLIGCVVPRPIAWVSTLAADGVPNLAPFSFFMGVCNDPPTIALCSQTSVSGFPSSFRSTRL